MRGERGEGVGQSIQLAGKGVGVVGETCSGQNVRGTGRI